MENDKYTFGSDEKQILEILASFEEELQERLQESKGEVERVKYYEKFQMQGIDFKNIFITTEKDVDGNLSYHVYCGDTSNELLSIEADGNIKIRPELQAFLGDLNLDEIMEENEKQPKRLKGISEKAKPEEVQEKLKQQQKEEQLQKEGQDTEEEQINEDLKDEKQEDLQIKNYRKIKDENLDKQMKGTFKSSEEKGVAYSEKLNAFILVEKVNGKFQRVEVIEPSKPTMKSVISINEDGRKIERKVPHALMKTKNPKKEMSITIGQYGYVEAATIDRLPCNERVEMQLRQDGEGLEGKRTKELQNLQTREGPEVIHELAHEFNKETEKRRDEATSLDQLRDDGNNTNDGMNYSDDEERRIEEEAVKAKVSVKEFKDHLEKLDRGTLEEKIEVVHAEIELEYGAPSREKNKE